jgi:3-hydroxy acid dehydrogenase/malonic semialdehyde reductase
MRGSPAVSTCFVDVRDHESVKSFHQHFVKSFGTAPDVLVNNAGLARGKDPVSSAQVADWHEMIETNVTGLALVTHSFLPSMIEKRTGDIVMIGSIAGSQSYEGGSVYCASKAAVTAFTNALRLEVNGSNIRVIQVDPGMVETEFSLVRMKDDALASKVYDGVEPLSGRDIGDAVAHAVNLPSRICVSNITLLPTQQASVSKVHRHSR